MGGMQTRVITLASPDTFSHVGMFSGGSISPEDVAGAPAFKEKIKLLFVSFGSRELENRDRPGRPRFGGDPKANTSCAQGGRDQHPLLRLARHRPRVADLAAQPVSVRPARVQGLGPSSLDGAPSPDAWAAHERELQSRRLFREAGGG